MKQEDIDKLKLNASLVLEQLGEIFEERNELPNKAVTLESAEIGTHVIMRMTMHDVRDGKMVPTPEHPGKPMCLLGKPPYVHPTKTFSGALCFVGDRVDQYHLLELPEGSYRAMAEIFYDFLVHGEKPGTDLPKA